MPTTPGANLVTLLKAMLPKDSAGTTAFKQMTRVGKTPGAMAQGKQKGGTWCPTCERYHRMGAKCESLERVAGVKGAKAATVPRVG